jgi:hypothetical protein
LINHWNHLFVDGEFMSRDRLLAGLTVEQIIVRPPGIAHSIFEELWHTTKWQSIVIQCNPAVADAWLKEGQDFPSDALVTESAWEDLVKEFLEGSKRAVELARSREGLAEPGEEGTLAERLASLAVHNAYHLGKIVALRQVIGLWPPNQTG